MEKENVKKIIKQIRALRAIRPTKKQKAKIREKIYLLCLPVHNFLLF